MPPLRKALSARSHLAYGSVQLDISPGPQRDATRTAQTVQCPTQLGLQDHRDDDGQRLPYAPYQPVEGSKPGEAPDERHDQRQKDHAAQ